MKNLPVNTLERQVAHSRYDTLPNYASPISPQGYEEDRSVHVNVYLNILRRRKWCIIIPILVIVPIAMMLVLLESPLYSSKSRILIERESPKVLEVEELLKSDPSLEFHITEQNLVKSRENAEEVVRILSLDTKPLEPKSFIEELIANTVGWAKTTIKSLMTQAMNLLAPPTEQTAVVALDPAELRRLMTIDLFLASVVVTPILETRLIDVAITGKNPKEVAQQANTLVDVYRRKNLEKKLETSRKAIEWLTQKTADLKDKMQASERALQAFREKRNVVSLDLEGKRNLIQERLAGLHTAYTQANTARIDFEARLNKMKAISADNIEDIGSLTAIGGNQIIGNLRQTYLGLLSQYQDATGSFTPKHPKMLQLKLQIETAKNALDQELQKTMNAMQAEYNILRSKEGTLVQELNSQKESTLGLNKDMITYAALQSEVENQRNLYLEAAKRLEEIKLTQALITNNITVVEKAIVPLEPVASKKIVILFASMILGGMFGTGLAFIKEYFANRFRTADEIESYLRIPFLGLIPHYVINRRRGALPVALRDPRSTAAEAYRLLRTRIFPSASTLQMLLVTSAVPEEGKSTTTANLGVSFAQLGLKVLILDADLRRPTLHRYFHLPKDKGLTTLLLGQEEEWQSVLYDTSMSNLKILPAGPTPHNPSDLLCLGALRRLFTQVKSAFDLVLVDAPLALSLPDVEILAPDMDGVIFVHDPSQCDKKSVLEARRRLERVGTKILGLVLNNVEEGSQQYYYHSYYPSYHIADVVQPETNHKQRFMESPAVKKVLANIPQKASRTSHAKTTLLVHGFQLQKEISGKRLIDNSIFLILDIEVFNKSEAPYYFNPKAVKLYTDAPGDYGLSLSKVMNGIENLSSKDVEVDSVYKYSEFTQDFEGGMVQERVIPPQEASRGAIVFQIPEDVHHFVLSHGSEFMNISISPIKSV